MQEDLQLLLQLSAVDKKVHELKQTKKDLPRRIQTLQEAINKEKAQLDRILAEITDTQAKVRENQDVIATGTEGLQTSSKRLDNISTNREYDAVHLEIASQKKAIDTAQASVLHFQQILENLQKDALQVEAAYKLALETHEPELTQLTAELSGIEDRVAEQAALAAEPRRKMSKKTLHLYDRIVQRRGTPDIIAAVNHDHKSCDVCSRNQFSQRLIEVRKGNTLLTCESCGSLLVWRQS